MRNNLGRIALALLVSITASAAWANTPTGWQATLDNAKRLAGQTNRLVLVFVHADWCQYCKVMEREFLDSPASLGRMQDGYVPVKVNADQFPMTAKQYGVDRMPTTLILSPDGQLLDKIQGRVAEPQFFARLDQVSAAVRARQQMYAGGPPSDPGYATAAGAPAAPPVAGPPVTAPVTNPAVPPAPGAGGRYAEFFANNQVAPPAAPAAADPRAAYPGGGDPRYAAMPSAPTYRQDVPGMPGAPGGEMPPGRYGPPVTAPAPTAPAAPPFVAATPPAMPQNPASPAGAAVPGQHFAAVAPPAPAAPAAPAAPEAATPGNPPLGLDGYCPVRLAETQSWVLGDRRWGVIHRGRTYLFAGEAERDRFFKTPDEYAPMMSGYDVVQAADLGRAIPGRREHGVFYENRIFLFADEASLQRFTESPARYTDHALQALRASNGMGSQLR
ncbi:MAG: thioredoxin family protein [Planctomycetota bacterium]